MKKLLSMATVALFVLSGTAFAAGSNTQPVKDAQQVSATAHKASSKAKQHKQHAKAQPGTKSVGQQPTTPAA
ncbi:hypothetical protein I2492_04505 [Budviciaceae bacterium CWB-B4]|uniref:Acid shock protein n=1 Tax=Limnobaculum xujianqingii TaxID=2738837 RepID=A0A9D7AGD0_9GAMM|nr:hypothetical protein [Limnobaculum xujianqingii]MBK5072277.1 hypothetical protein [Limnobaculum xujianqingii]MBK5175586.1 hypothetical protein [Limnobaculum xujianqingii]